MDRVRDAGFRGLSVTIPFKEEVLPLLDEVDDHSRAIGAVNTVLFTGGRSLGFVQGVPRIRVGHRSQGAGRWWARG